MSTAWKETCETTQPWVIYTYGRSHDGWWPIWTSTRLTGRARIGLECCVCGTTTVVSLRLPRFGAVPEPATGRHSARERFLADHAHPDRGHPMSWARPLRNALVFGGEGMPLDLLAMRLEAEVRKERDGGDPQDAPVLPAVDAREIPMRDCYAEMVGLPQYCRLRDGVCESDPCREWESK